MTNVSCARKLSVEAGSLGIGDYGLVMAKIRQLQPCIGSACVLPVALKMELVVLWGYDEYQTVVLHLGARAP